MVNESEVLINLLSWRAPFRVWQKRQLIKRISQSIGLAILVVISIHVGIHLQIKNFKHQFHQLVQARQSIATDVLHVQQLEVNRNQLLKNISDVKQVYIQQMALIHLLQTIAEMMPTSVFLTELSYGRRLFLLQGQSTSTHAAAVFFKNLTTQKKFQGVQVVSMSNLNADPKAAVVFKAKVYAR